MGIKLLILAIFSYAVEMISAVEKKPTPYGWVVAERRKMIEATLPDARTDAERREEDIMKMIAEIMSGPSPDISGPSPDINDRSVDCRMFGLVEQQGLKNRQSVSLSLKEKNKITQEFQTAVQESSRRSCVKCCKSLYGLTVMKFVTLVQYNCCGCFLCEKCNSEMIEQKQRIFDFCGCHGDQIKPEEFRAYQVSLRNGMVARIIDVMEIGSKTYMLEIRRNTCLSVGCKELGCKKHFEVIGQQPFDYQISHYSTT